MKSNRPIPRVAAINDLSGFGRCSLTVAIPVLSAMGIQVCPLPTVILSNHTGYSHFTFDDYTDRMESYIENWKQLQLEFDALYSGFFANAEQISKIAEFISFYRKSKPLVLVDPVMADNGKMYATCTNELLQQMQKLVSMATVATPNVTEACLLTGTDYGEWEQAENKIERCYCMAKQLVNAGCKQVVITGVRTDDQNILNIVYDGENEPTYSATQLVPAGFSGTGDVFASVLCGCLIKGLSLYDAVKTSARFLYQVTKETYQSRLPTLDGITFEPFLGELCNIIVNPCTRKENQNEKL